MGTNPSPAPQATPPVAPPTVTLLPAIDAQAHYESLLAYFKNLVWLASGAMAVIVLVGGYVFHSDLQTALRDTEQKATKAVNNKVDSSVHDAFIDKNINQRIEAAAKDKIGTITDRMIEQQIGYKLQPIEQRIVLIGRISECEARIHAGFRSALVELTDIQNSANDPQVRQFANSTFTTTAQGYDSYWQINMKNWQNTNKTAKPIDLLRSFLTGKNGPSPKPVSNLGDVVQVINEDQDLNSVACATLVFRDISGEPIKMFDFGAVKSWCAKNEPKCSH
jgi:hypothetical protein